MRNFFEIICIIFLLNSCNHNIPIATLEYTDFQENNDGSNSFFLYLSSNVKLVENPDWEHNGPRFKCFFDEKTEKMDLDYIHGTFHKYRIWAIDFSIDSTKTSDSLFFYKAKVYFEYSDSPENDTSEELTKSEIIELIRSREQECFDCFVYAVSKSWLKPYISNTMCLPTKEVIKELN